MVRHVKAKSENIIFIQGRIFYFNARERIFISTRRYLWTISLHYNVGFSYEICRWNGIKSVFGYGTEITKTKKTDE